MLKKNQICLILILLLSVACSSSYLSQSQETKNAVNIRGGKFHNDSWEDSWMFKRYSWYQGVNLEFDVLTSELKESSPFSKWLEESEKDYLSKCSHFYIAFLYIKNNSKSSISSLRKQFEDNGLKEITIPNFSDHMKQHNAMSDWNLTGHKIVGFCQSTMGASEFDMNFPGFNSQRVNLK